MNELDLSGYPEFLAGKKVRIVVGAGAPTSDVVGAIDIASGLIESQRKSDVDAQKLVLAVLDSEMTAAEEDYDLVVVGSPEKNLWAAKLLGYDRLLSLAEMRKLGFQKGKGKIKLFTEDGRTRLLVTGYGPEEVLGCCYVVRDYNDYAMSGTELEVVVADIDMTRVLDRGLVIPSDINERIRDKKILHITNELIQDYNEKKHISSIALAGCLTEIVLKRYLSHVVSVDKTKLKECKEGNPDIQDLIFDKMMLNELIQIFNKIEVINKDLFLRLLLVMELRNHFLHSSKFDYSIVETKFKEKKVKIEFEFAGLTEEQILLTCSRICAQFAISFATDYSI